MYHDSFLLFTDVSRGSCAPARPVMRLWTKFLPEIRVTGAGNTCSQTLGSSSMHPTLSNFRSRRSEWRQHALAGFCHCCCCEDYSDPDLSVRPSISRECRADIFEIIHLFQFLAVHRDVSRDVASALIGTLLSSLLTTTPGAAPKGRSLYNLGAR